MSCSGKSSIVCALCLGLGGDTSDMKRAKDPGSYVRSGTREAIIDIVLQGPPGAGDIKVTRTIKLASASKGNADRAESAAHKVSASRTSWMINDAPSTEDTVNGLMEALSIQARLACTCVGAHGLVATLSAQVHGGSGVH